ncbi:MAG: Apolipoprotein N-acyltransferase [Chlamydiae bacterium]|nr:Apolipoprotein N-acyltransferase [Chlamydiota bacterium]
MSSLISNYFKQKSRLFIALTLLISWAIVAFGQPARSSFLGILSSVLGLALFWRVCLNFSERKQQFYLSFIWFMAVESIHLSWMTATEYQGNYIYIVYLIVLAALSAQFGLLTLFICKKPFKFSLTTLFFLSGFWVLMEWIRLFLMSGFPFNPIGLSLSSTNTGMQWASIGGIYFLSFWVVLTNLFFLKCLLNSSKLSNWITFSLIALTPYLYGFSQLSIQGSKIKKETQYVNALLVQTALSPEKKTGMKGYDRMLPPLDQWGAIFTYLAPYRSSPIDLIVFPERTVPFADTTELYPIEYVERLIRISFGEKALTHLNNKAEEREIVDNLFISQFLADYFKAQIIVGLETLVEETEDDYVAFASAFSFRPYREPEAYHKRILLPIVEYLPFKWCEDLAKKYHIFGWYQRGREPKIFEGDLRVAPSICIEELYGSLMRKNRLLGGQLFVNITNDVWFPDSLLPKQHYDHGRIRAVENGTPVLRSCNTGVTVALDALGREVENFHTHLKTSQWKQGALHVQVPRHHFKTLYLYVGNYLIIGLSVISVILNLFFNQVFIFKKYSSFNS